MSKQFCNHSSRRTLTNIKIPEMCYIFVVTSVFSLKIYFKKKQKMDVDIVVDMDKHTHEWLRYLVACEMYKTQFKIKKKMDWAVVAYICCHY